MCCNEAPLRLKINTFVANGNPCEDNILSENTVKSYHCVPPAGRTICKPDISIELSTLQPGTHELVVNSL